MERAKDPLQFKTGTYKCDKFVSDVLEKTGAKVPQIGGILEGDPPSAENWENANLEIEGYEIVDEPKPGDVANLGTQYYFSGN